jgi:hypothetical protein
MLILLAITGSFIKRLIFPLLGSMAMELLLSILKQSLRENLDELRRSEAERVRVLEAALVDDTGLDLRLV